ncbi:hypothetical protein EII29_09220 [Leptotrichia sp. OH3620_COT-345]|uniref:hypothetical protein n=1 Tax=Leptotrichia sp. OH3620_COT-345 TaxID=2491048 RepID=UPI000F645832|nr:hypothetical protein [Leptotrichia sp. OH3620_COT-345]RRD38966.1 hypothetical protein EII29_09220 [Leptotrichia sp. OH3620_COT-345]
MKKYLFLPILLIFINCTTVNLTRVETEKINTEVTDTIEELKEAANFNKYDKLKEFFLPTFKNNIIVNNIKQYNLSKLTFIFSEVKVISKNKVKGIMIVNYGSESNYYIVTWKMTNENGRWKISNVDEKK